jgi:hypothetical protein
VANDEIQNPKKVKRRRGERGWDGDWLEIWRKFVGILPNFLKFQNAGWISWILQLLELWSFQKALEHLNFKKASEHLNFSVFKEFQSTWAFKLSKIFRVSKLSWSFRAFEL